MLSPVTSPNAGQDGTDARHKLARAVRDRRLQLRLSARAAADLAGVARGTWIALEDASRRTAETNYAGIERALQWKAGSVARILDGGEPTVLDDSTVMTTPATVLVGDPRQAPPLDDPLVKVMRDPNL